MRQLYDSTPKHARRFLSTRELGLTSDTSEAAKPCQTTPGGVTADTIATIPCKAITVYPIWAWAIVHGFKRVENRSRPASYRGRLAIHAGLNRQTETAARAMIEALGLRVPGGLAGGVILGTVDLVGCVPYAGEITADPWASGPFCWLLENPQLLPEPIPCKGALSLWTCQLPADV